MFNRVQNYKPNNALDKPMILRIPKPRFRIILKLFRRFNEAINQHTLPVKYAAKINAKLTSGDRRDRQAAATNALTVPTLSKITIIGVAL